MSAATASSASSLAVADDVTITSSTTEVVIVGAGAAGLQCASRLLSAEYGYPPEAVAILEARGRVGGRIHTTTEKIRKSRAVVSGTTTTTTDDDDDEELVDVCLDHGAAWLHGTALDWGVPLDAGDTAKDSIIPTENPMMDLLQKATPDDGDGTPSTTVYDRHLDPVFRAGNPWTRPRTVLHDSGEIALFVDGDELLLDDNDDGTDKGNDNDDSAVVAEALRRHFAILDRVSELGNRLYAEGEGMETATMSLQDAIDRCVGVQDTVLDDEGRQASTPSFSDRDWQRIDALTPFYLHLLECWYGADASELQLCEFVNDDDDDVADDPNVTADDDAEYAEEGDFYGAHCTLKRGMGALLGPLLDDNGVRARVRLDERVVRIRQLLGGADDAAGAGVEVITSKGTRIRAKVCVVTVPIGCLQSDDGLLFEPPLSPEKLRAISSTKMGSYKKVFLVFDRIFWPPRQAFIGLVRPKRQSSSAWRSPLGDYLLVNNLWARDGVPCIEAILFGSAGRWATHKSDGVIRDAVLDFMVDAMGFTDEDNIKGCCVDCLVTRWEEDPFSKGAYSSVALGASIVRHVEELTRPEWDGRLLFSGEATVTEFEGSVHAALFSGKNAAEAAHRFLASCKEETNDENNTFNRD